MSLVRCAAIPVVFGLLAGCALQDATLQPPRRDGFAAASRRGAGREVLVAGRFGSRRTENRCGMRKNGFNADTASVRCNSAPETLLPGVLATQLAAAGFKVLQDRRLVTPSTIVLNGVVDQLFLEAKQNFFTMTFETDIGLSLTATTGSGHEASRRFYVKGEEATYWGGERDMQLSFESGVRELASTVVGAVENLAERWPAELTGPAAVPASTDVPTVNPS